VLYIACSDRVNVIVTHEAKQMGLKEHLWGRVSLSGDSSSSEQSSSYSVTPRGMGSHMGLAVACAFVGLFIFPEIFDSIAIILGAQAWKKQKGNAGLYVVIFGIACMLIGLYFTAFVLYDLVPS
jgi:hypothetical protein